MASAKLHFHADPDDFLTAAADYLAAEPAINTIVTVGTHRASARLADGAPQSDGNWWLTVRDERGSVCGAGMCATAGPLASPFLLPMPDEAAVALAHTLYERDEKVFSINGALPVAELCAAELARLEGGDVRGVEHARLYELGSLVPPASAPGRLIAATEGDLELVMEWLAAFMGDAAEQAGRQADEAGHTVVAAWEGEVLSRVQAGLLWFWLDGNGQRVHLTGVTPPSFGAVRIAVVYTPPAHRGQGWASNAVAEVSRRIQAQGARACLFTDPANPTSNKIYTALGYRPVIDMAEIAIIRHEGSTSG